MSLDYAKLYPWKGIEAVTIDGQAMVKIPKFYVRVAEAPEGTDNAGKKCFFISPSPRPGYHVHPAFLHKGKEIDCFYIGAYEAWQEATGVAGSAAGKAPWVSITFDQAQAACLARNKGDVDGFHLYNFYERSAVALLCMLEIESPDAQTKIGAGQSATNNTAAVNTGASNAVWRGIHEFWGNAWEWCDGLKTLADGATVEIFDNKGYGEYVTTSLTLPAASNLGIQAMAENEGEDYDLKDVFVPGTLSGAANASTYADGAWNTLGAQHNLIVGGSWLSGASAGLFTFRTDHAPSGPGAGIGFRLAKYGD